MVPRRLLEFFLLLDIFGFPDLGGFGERLRGPRCVTLPFEKESEVVPGRGVEAIERDGPAQSFNCPIGVALLLQRGTEDVPGIVVIGALAHSGAQFLNGFVGKSGIDICESQTVVRLDQRWVQSHCPLEFRSGMRQVVGLLVGNSQIVMRTGIIGLVPDQRRCRMAP